MVRGSARSASPSLLTCSWFRASEWRRTSCTWPRSVLCVPSVLYAALLVHGLLTFWYTVDLFDGRCVVQVSKMHSTAHTATLEPCLARMIPGVRTLASVKHPVIVPKRLAKFCQLRSCFRSSFQNRFFSACLRQSSASHVYSSFCMSSFRIFVDDHDLTMILETKRAPKASALSYSTSLRMRSCTLGR